MWILNLCLAGSYLGDAMDFFFSFFFFFLIFLLFSFMFFFIIIITVQICKFNITVSTQFLQLYTPTPLIFVS